MKLFVHWAFSIIFWTLDNSSVAAPKVEDDGPVDIGRIDLRVGKIVGGKPV